LDRNAKDRQKGRSESQAMKRTLRRTRQFEADLVDIYVHLHRQSPQAAEKVFSAIETSARKLIDMPGVGRSWDSSDPRLAGIRVTTVTPYRNYLLFFRPARDHVLVCRVLHAARHLQHLLDELDFAGDD
jgi:plasmid stabilization system protein ParE